jgi:hypothetical protein
MNHDNGAEDDRTTTATRACLTELAPAAQGP